MGCADWLSVPAHRMAQGRGLLSDVVYSRILASLQCGRSSFLVGQSCDHHTRLGFWHTDLAVLYRSSHNQSYLDLGVKRETVALVGGI